MNNRLIIYLFLFFGLNGPGHLFAQQEQLYTQFMYNKLALNPAYAGYHDHLCLTAIYRNQWNGIEGAPQTQMLSLNMPLENQKVGLGFNLLRNTIGISERITLEGIYSYKIPMGEGLMGLGVQASIRNHSIDYTDDRLYAVQPLTIDNGVEFAKVNKYVANFGFGFYYYTDRFYFGGALPRLMHADIDFGQSDLFLSQEVRHAYIMSGLALPVGEYWTITPQVLLKWAENSPLDFDLNLSASLYDAYTFGVTYRAGGSSTSFGESIDLILALQVTPNLLLGFGYDITLSEIKRFENGSIEALLRYCFGKNTADEEFINPRYF